MKGMIIMNKLFTKIAGLTLGLAMAVGVGVAVGKGERAVPAHAAITAKVATIDLSSFDGSTSSISDSLSQSWAYAYSGQAAVKSNNSMFRIGTNSGTSSGTATFTIASTTLGANINFTSAVFHAKVKSNNCGSVSAKIGGNTAVSGSPSTTVGDVTCNLSSYTGITSGNVVLSIICSSKCIDVDSITLNYSVVTADKTLSTIAVSTAPTTTTYYAGETFNPAGLVITRNYTDSTSDTYAYAGHASDFTFTPSTSTALTTDNTSVTIGYGGKTCSQAITVNPARVLSSIAITTAPTKTIYTVGESFDSTGMVVTATYTNSTTSDVTASCTFSPNGALTTSDVSITVTYTLNDVTKTATQAITVNAVPGVVNFGTATGAIQMSSGSGSGTDTLGNTVSSSCTSTAYQSNSSSYTQVGSKDNPLVTWTTTVTFSERVGVKSFEIKFAGSAGKSDQEYIAYADSVNDVILSGEVDGQTVITDSTDVNYSTINADSITVSFTGSSYGVQLYYFSYVLGDTVQEFGTLDKIEVKAGSTHETTFKVGQTFSSAGLVIVATDTVDFSKEFTNGFTTDYDDHVFVVGDVANGVTVTVSLTVGSKTKTTTYTINIINPPTYSTISSQEDLYEGMKVVIYGSSNKALGAENSGYFDEGAVTFDGDDIDDGSNALEFTVRIYGNVGFALQSGTKYLQYHGTGNNAYLDSTLDTKAVWTFGDDGLVNVADTTRELRHNSGATRFACYSNSGQSITGARVSLYLSSATPRTDSMEADTFAQRYLHMRDYLGNEGQSGSNYCLDTGDGAGKNYFDDAATAYALLSSAVKTEFKKNTEAVKRFNAWATANHKTINLDTGVVSSSGSLISIFNDSENSSVAIVIIVIIMIASLSVAGYFFIRRRKEQ